MRESWGESRGKLCWYPHWEIIVTGRTITFWNVIWIVSFVCKVSVTSSTCIIVFWYHVPSLICMYKCDIWKLSQPFTRNWIICFHLVVSRWWVIIFGYIYRSITAYINIFSKNSLPIFTKFDPNNEIIYWGIFSSKVSFHFINSLSEVVDDFIFGVEFLSNM